MKKIYINVMGGLGNQLYQYAFARRYELKYGKNIKLLSYFFWNKYIREVLLYKFTKNHQALGYHNGFQLDVFNIKKQNIWLNNLLYIFKFLTKNINRYNEEECNRMPESIFKDNKKDVYFFGYFGDIKYFEPYRDILLKELTLKNISEGCKIWKNKINSTKNSVSLHIMRGDYVINPVVKKSSFVLSEETDYCNKAIDYLKNKIGEINLFIFSDDLEWVRNNMKFENANYVEYENQKKNSHEDMFLMSECMHNITANSTFSWWGGWLNKNPDKIVIIPKYWIKNPLNEINQGMIAKNFITLEFIYDKK